MLIQNNQPKLSRRALLRTSGVALGLPFLEAMLPTSAMSAGNFPQRLYFMFCPTGHNVEALRAVGPNFNASPLLKPLEDEGVWEDVMMVTNLNNMGKLAPQHPRESASYLTCFKNDGKQVTNGTSIDQVYADIVGKDTKFASLEVGPDDGKRGSCGRGAPCVYNNTISWRGSTPNPPIPTAKAAKEHLFKGFDPGASANVNNSVSNRGKSVLDYVRNQADSLNRRLGAIDRGRMDQYLTSVRELEKRIESTNTMATGCSPAELVGVDNPHPENVAQMLELSAIAFSCDLTRVGTFMFGSGGSSRSLDFINISTSHHGASHNNRDAHKKMSIWEAAQFAHFIKAMKSLPEGDGTVLDNTIIQYGGGMSDNHNNDNLTMVLAGRGGGLKPGRNLNGGGKKLAGFYVDMMQMVGAPVDSFRDTGPAGILV